MKKYLFILLIALFSIPAAFSQDADKTKMREELKQFKIDFLAKEMNLSEKEKAEFTPIYNDFDEQRRRAGAEAWKFEKELKKKKDASDADYKKLAELQQQSRDKDNEIVKKLDARLESFLSAKQIYQMHRAEEKFFDKMKEMHRKHRDGKHPKPDGKPSGRKSRDKRDSPEPDEDCPLT